MTSWLITQRWQRARRVPEAEVNGAPPRSFADITAIPLTCITAGPVHGIRSLPNWCFRAVLL
jgi:hypothetical protein